RRRNGHAAATGTAQADARGWRRHARHTAGHVLDDHRQRRALSTTRVTKAPTHTASLWLNASAAARRRHPRARRRIRAEILEKLSMWRGMPSARPDPLEGPMIALKKILVATDFSEPADAALAYGRAFARTFGGTLYLLHVVDDMYLRLGGDAYAAVLPDLQQDVEREARQRLARIAADG